MVKNFIKIILTAIFTYFPDAIIGSKGKIQIDLACESPKRGYFYCKYSNDTIISMQLPADTDNWVLQNIALK